MIKLLPFSTFITGMHDKRIPKIKYGTVNSSQSILTNYIHLSKSKQIVPSNS